MLDASRGDRGHRADLRRTPKGVFGVLPIPPDFVRLQIEIVLDDIGADAVKTGMLHDTAVIESVAGVLQERAGRVPLVVDPVMAAKGGARLIDPDAVETLKRLLIERATVLILEPRPRPRSWCCWREPATSRQCARAGEKSAGAAGCRAVLAWWRAGLSGDIVTDGWRRRRPRKKMEESAHLPSRHDPSMGPAEERWLRRCRRSRPGSRHRDCRRPCPRL